MITIISLINMDPRLVKKKISELEFEIKKLQKENMALEQRLQNYIVSNDIAVAGLDARLTIREACACL